MRGEPTGSKNQAGRPRQTPCSRGGISRATAPNPMRRRRAPEVVAVPDVKSPAWDGVRARLRQCVVCGKHFAPKGFDKTCTPEHRKEYQLAWRRKTWRKYYNREQQNAAARRRYKVEMSSAAPSSNNAPSAAKSFPARAVVRRPARRNIARSISVDCAKHVAKKSTRGGANTKQPIERKSTRGGANTKQQMKDRRKACRRERQRDQAYRRANGAKPRARYEAESLARVKPREAEGISRRTWYRRRGTSPSAALFLSLPRRGLVPSGVRLGPAQPHACPSTSLLTAGHVLIGQSWLGVLASQRSPTSNIAAGSAARASPSRSATTA